MFVPYTFTDLFPKQIARPPPNNTLWYCGKQPIVKNVLCELLPRFSATLHLSKRYTNHCVRVTTDAVMKLQEFANEDISNVNMKSFI